LVNYYNKAITSHTTVRFVSHFSNVVLSIIFFTARRYASAVDAVAPCLCVNHIITLIASHDSSGL